MNHEDDDHPFPFFPALLYLFAVIAGGSITFALVDWIVENWSDFIEFVRGAMT